MDSQRLSSSDPLLIEVRGPLLWPTAAPTGVRAPAGALPSLPFRAAHPGIVADPESRLSGGPSVPGPTPIRTTCEATREQRLTAEAPAGA
jgi:hypothetical protein